MFALDGGVPVVAGRRFPWAKKVDEIPNECGAVGFTLMMENGWTVRVLFNLEHQDWGCAFDAYGLGGQWYWEDGWSKAEYPHVATADECLRLIDKIATMPSATQYPPLFRKTPDA